MCTNVHFLSRISRGELDKWGDFLGGEGRQGNFGAGEWTTGEFSFAGGVLLPSRVSEKKMGERKMACDSGDVDWCDEGAGGVSTPWCVAVSFRNGFGVDNAELMQ